MSADCVLTGEPEFIFQKKYTEKPKEEDLFEIFVIVYKVKIENWETDKTEDDALRMIFFNNVEKAVKRFKLFGPKAAILKRILTDSVEMNEIAEKNNHIEIDEEETDEENDKQVDENITELAKELAIKEGAEVSKAIVV